MFTTRPALAISITLMLLVLPAGASQADEMASATRVEASQASAPQAEAVPIAPAKIAYLRDTPNDGGTSMDIGWEVSPTEKSAPGTVIEYKIMRANSPTGEFTEAGSVPAGTTAFSEGGCVAAAAHWVYPTYEAPNIPTLPSAQGWCAAHSTES